MSRRCLFPFSFLLPGAVLLSGSGEPGHLLPSLDDPRTVSARLELETRRARGPRSDRLASILRSEARSSKRLRASFVVESCVDGALRCSDFSDLAAECISEDAGPRRQKDILDLHRIRQEADLEAMDADKRIELFRSVLRGRSATVGDLVLDWEAVAFRVVRARIDTLLPDVRATMTQPSHAAPPQLLQDMLRVREASLGSDGAETLLQLLQPIVECQVRGLLGAAKPGDSCGTPNLANLLVAELRRLGNPEVVPRLKELLQLYSRDDERQRELFESRRASLGNKTPYFLPESSMPTYRTALARQLVLLIGDLGDRGFEREVLAARFQGEAALWDVVRDVERVLHARRELSHAEAVTELEAGEVR